LHSGCEGLGFYDYQSEFRRSALKPSHESLLVRLIGDAALRTLTFPAGWRFVVSAAPTDIAANKVG
jgi:hypothetical protein